MFSFLGPRIKRQGFCLIADSPFDANSERLEGNDKSVDASFANAAQSPSLYKTDKNLRAGLIRDTWTPSAREPPVSYHIASPSRRVSRREGSERRKENALRTYCWPHNIFVASEASDVLTPHLVCVRVPETIVGRHRIPAHSCKLREREAHTEVGQLVVPVKLFTAKDRLLGICCLSLDCLEQRAVDLRKSTTTQLRSRDTCVAATRCCETRAQDTWKSKQREVQKSEDLSLNPECKRTFSCGNSQKNASVAGYTVNYS
jgi:hypothetical protein